MQRLTNAEEQIMQILWRLEKAYVKDIIKELPLPKPAYNTVSTIVRILEKKGFVGHKAFGKKYEYYVLTDKKEYRKKYFSGFIKNYFENSYKSLASFFTKEEDLSLEELEEIKQLIEAEMNKKQSEK